MLKLFYQKWRRFEYLNKISEGKRSRSGGEEETGIEVDGGAKVGMRR